METICGQYGFDEAARSLSHLDSGQSIREVQSEGGLRRFEYSDTDVTLTFGLEIGGTNLQIATSDFHEPSMEAAHQTYGLWRRLAFFLLDALTVWLFAAERGRQNWQVHLRGGWQNGRWNPALVLKTSNSGLPSGFKMARGRYSEAVVHPLDLEPRSWRYVSVDDPILEAALATIPGRGDIPLIDLSTPIDEQLAKVPRFVRDDDQATLFHRYAKVNFSRGEDYSPIPYYGYINETMAFTFYSQSFQGVGGYMEPMTSKSNEDLRTYLATFNPELGGISLPPTCREELFYALIDIQEVIENILDKRYPILPMILERDRERIEYFKKINGFTPQDERHFLGVRFGSDLNCMRGLPLRSPLGITKTSIERDLRVHTSAKAVE